MKIIITTIFITAIAVIYSLTDEYTKEIIKHNVADAFVSDLNISEIEEGKHYLMLDEKITIINDDLVLFFIYDSEDSLTLVHELKNGKHYGSISLSHATYNKEWEEQSRLFYSLKEFGSDKSTITEVFKMYADDGRLNKVRLNKYFTSIDLPNVQFWSVFDSINLNSIIEKQREIEGKTNTEGFPIILVKGQYVIKPWLLKSYSHTNTIIDFLINKK